MSMVDQGWERPDHPWLAEFAAEPERQLDRLLRGVALIHPYDRAETGDILWTLFGALDESDPLRAALDQTLVGWLEQRRRQPPEQRLTRGINRYVDEVADALAVVPRLDLRHTAGWLRQHYPAYRQWTGALILGSSRDPLARFWQTLAYRQPDDHFAYLWYRLCDGAGNDTFPDHYLSLGLLGLRRLPGEEASVLTGVLGGLTTWARHLPDTKAGKREFLDQWRALLWLYPRGPGFWRYLAKPLAEVARRKEWPFGSWWDAELQPGKPGNGKSMAFRRIDPPSVEERKDIEHRLSAGEPLASLSGDLERLMGRHVAYAEATGDSHFVVRTACNLGSRLLDAAPDRSLTFARLAVRWEPGNPHGWTLWAEALVRLERGNLAEFVFWEAIRRFPDDAVSRGALADLLAGMGRSSEAEALYRETIRRFPDEAVSWTALGHLLLDQRRFDEAGKAVDELERLGSRHAAASLANAIRQEQKGRPRPEAVASDRSGPRDAVPLDEAAYGAVRLNGQVRRAEFRFSAAFDYESACADVMAVLREEANHAYAWLVQVERMDGGGAVEAFPSFFPWRFKHAMGQPEALAKLADEFPGLEPVVRLARLAFVPEATADDWSAVARWLSQDPDKADWNPAVAYVLRAMRRLAGPTGADNTLSITTLRDLVESRHPEVVDILSLASRCAADMDTPDAVLAA